MCKKIVKGSIVIICILMNILVQSQTKAAIHFQNGETKHLFLRQQILQEDESLITTETLKSKRKKISLEDVKYIAIYPPAGKSDSVYVMPINVHINAKKNVKRWLTKLHQGNNISVFYGFYAKGLKRDEASVYYYENSGVYPMHYLYVKRPSETSATIWWSQDINLDGEIPAKQRIKFLERTAQYFSDAPKLRKEIDNGQLAPRDWKYIVYEYETEMSKNNKNSKKREVF